MDEQLETAAQDDIREYLIFTVDSIDFGIDIGLVQEIIKIQPISLIPNAHLFCKGIINIRGTIVPVLDMRVKLGFQAVAYSERTCIVVLALGSEQVGVIVDMVQDVVRIPAGELTDAPALRDGDGKGGSTAKIANVGGKIRQILDVNSVFHVDIE